jgi:hypothetical protein
MEKHSNPNQVVPNVFEKSFEIESEFTTRQLLPN